MTTPDPYADGLSISFVLTGPAEPRDVEVARELLEEWLESYETAGAPRYRNGGVGGEVGATTLVLWADRIAVDDALERAHAIGARAERRLPLVRYEVSDAAAASAADLESRLGAPVIEVRPGGDAAARIPSVGRRVEATVIGREATPCHLIASPDGLTVEWGADRLSFTPAKLERHVRLGLGVIMRPALWIRAEGERLTVQLEPSAVAALLGGLGPSLATRWAVRQHVRWFIPIALLFIVSSLPVPGDPSSGLEPYPLDGLGMTLGVGLLAMAVLARVRPMGWLLVGDAVWLGVLAARGAYEVALGESHWAWLLLHGWLALMALTALKTYRAVRSSTRSDPG